MAWTANEKKWAREMARDYFYAGAEASSLDIETLLFGDTDAERKTVATNYAKNAIKSRKQARKAALEDEIDAIDAEVADIPTE